MLLFSRPPLNGRGSKEATESCRWPLSISAARSASLLLFHRHFLLSGNSGPAERGGRRTGHASHLNAFRRVYPVDNGHMRHCRSARASRAHSTTNPWYGSAVRRAGYPHIKFLEGPSDASVVASRVDALRRGKEARWALTGSR